MNMNNFGVLRGRLVSDPVTFANKDGSHKVKFTLACENNFKNRETGKRDSEMIPVEAYTKDLAASPFSKIHKGDKISVECSHRSNNYEKDGQMIYTTILFAEGIQFEESKSVTDARAAENAAKAAAAAAPAQA